MRLRAIWFLVPIGLFVLCGCTDKTNPWSAMAKTDLDYIKRMVEENHPGYVDSGNPQFKITVEKSYQNVIGQLKYVQSLDALMNLNNEFVASFADDHFVVNFRFARSYRAWAGIKIQRSQGQYKVTRLANDWPVALPPLGAELISCDDRSVNDIMRLDILRYRLANYSDDFPRVMFASKLLIDDGVGFRKNSIECVFRDQSAKEITLPIQWQASGDLGAEWDASRNSNSESFYLEPVGQSLFWVRASSFTFMTESAGLAKLRGVIATLADMNLTTDKTVVFDVRGNGGGSALYGLQLLEAALGRDNYWALWMNSALQDNNVNQVPKGVLWRASQDNLDQIKKAVFRIHADDAVVPFFKTLAADMEQDILQKKLFTLQPQIKLKGMPDNVREVKEIKPLPRVVAITDHFCASACLDFIMAASVIPNFLQLGEQTYADTAYNEPLHFAEPIELPSKLGWFYYPSKIAGQRGPFTPKIIFDGDINDTPALKNWVMGLPELNVTH